jgi:hypothetical protein
MRKVFVATSAAILLAASSLSALAAEASGTIANIDLDARTITLADGSTYVLPETFDAAALQVGQAVNVTYEQDAASGQMMASDVAPAT